MSTLGRLQSGAAGTMQKMSSLWGGKSGYTETSFLDDDLGRPESLDAVQKTSPKQPEAAKPTQREANEPWNQAATVRAQLEEELKREGVSRSSPQQQNLNVRSRTQSTESANQIPKSPVLDSADPLGGDRSRKRTNTDKRIKKDRDKKGSPDSIWAVPNDGFGEADRTDSPIGIGNPWTSSPRMEAAKPEVAKSSDIWDFPSTNNTFAWPPQKSVSAALPSAAMQPPSSAKAAAASLADGFASPTTLPWGGEGNDCNSVDSPGSPERTYTEAEKSYAVPASPEAFEAPLEPLVGPFDEAILAALVALPQQALVGVLRRLGARRPAEVALVFGAHQSSAVSVPSQPPKSWQNSSVASVNGAVPLQEAPEKAISEVVEAAQDRGSTPSVNEELAEQPSRSPSREAAPPVSPEAPIALPPPGASSSSPIALPPSPAPASPQPVVAVADSPLTDPVTTVLQASMWPPGPPASVVGSNVFEESPWPAPSSSTTQQAADLWPPLPPEGSTQSSSSPWPPSGGQQGSPWPPAGSGSSSEWRF
eukprot:CAMPEP_0169234088 /NCGR_PEP_ID=MMETSP1016-20121227/27978_1 /TAXON_ID=342587 /ORGANISM="Karlodinium micrum, Strain CCMP2283" /LENGTH=534 /DNA_ID=CAMNT_0009313505 /DNA_START=35 /DNA_END=1636 /DNA_ORIENTATION=-